MPDTAHTALHSSRPGDKAERDARREQVAVMLLSRITYRDMAKRLGVSFSTVRNDVNILQKRWHDRHAEQYQAHVAEQLAIIDAVVRAWLPRALGTPADKDAADTVFKALRERARLLGTDAPERLHLEATVTTETVLDGEIRRLLEQAQHTETTVDVDTTV